MILSYITAAALVVWVVICSRRRPLWGLYTVMASVPLSYRPEFKGTPLYFLVEISLASFAAVVLFTRRDCLRTLRGSPFLVFVPFLGFVALSSLWAANPEAVLKETVRWGEFVLLGLTATCVIDRKAGFDKPPSFLGWLGVIVSIGGIIQFLQGINQAPHRPGAAFLGHPNTTAAFLSLCILPVLGLLIQERRRHLTKRIMMFLIMILGLAFTFSRGVILACAIGGAFFLFDVVRSRLVRNRFATGVLVGILVTMGSLAVIPRFRHTAIQRVVSLSGLGERQSIFAFGWSIFKERSWLGLGAGNLKPYALKHNLKVHQTGPFEPNYGDLHSLFLQLAVETGSIGLLIFLGGLAGFSFVVLRRKRLINPTTEPLYKSLWAVSLTYLLANMSGFYTVKGIHLEWAILLAVLVALAQDTSSLHA